MATRLLFFEITTVAAFLLFSKFPPADVLILEVGLGGRLDATNVIDAPPAASVITPIAHDHEGFLGGLRSPASLAKKRAS